MTQKILAERMREQGWPLKRPQEALSDAMKKQGSRVPIRTTLFVCEALGLNEEQESRLFEAVRKTELKALEGHRKRDA
jgi:hypothetical protein